MSQSLSLVAILVPSYDAGFDFYVGKMGWRLIEDTRQSESKRWVRVAPSESGTEFLLARAIGNQKDFIGKQGGGRVWLFLETDDFKSDFEKMSKAGIHFEEAPRTEPYGKVAVFCDPFGNRWDLIEYVRPESC